ncbi:hypothetical protein [uncultured Bacteroides sp.]|jgi:hypothetical protein|uniref:hypothetical protein n=1 Tax=uncultured Bacteroides sp. TaxID=162156 RepID=UPI002590F225|nr:hypothetical protein [uncultured Bacteroides sp.]
MKKNVLFIYESPRLKAVEILLEQVIAASRPVEMENGSKLEEQWIDEELVYDGGDIQLK